MNDDDDDDKAITIPGQYCALVFNGMDNYREHYSKVHDMKMCLKCKKTFASRSGLQKLRNLEEKKKGS